MAFHMEKQESFQTMKTRLFLISDSLQELGVDSKIKTSVQSDHSAIVLNLSPTNKGKRGRSYWKFNSSLLDDKGFKAKNSGVSLGIL